MSYLPGPPIACFFKKSTSALAGWEKWNCRHVPKKLWCFLRWQLEKQSMVFGVTGVAALDASLKTNLSPSFIPQPHPWQGDVRNIDPPAVVSRVCWSASKAVCQAVVHQIALSGEDGGGQEHPMCEKAAWIMQGLSWHMCVHDLSFTVGKGNATESKYLLWAGCEKPEFLKLGCSAHALADEA